MSDAVTRPGWYLVAYMVTPNVSSTGIAALGRREVRMDAPPGTLAEVHALDESLSDQLRDVGDVRGHQQVQVISWVWLRG
jgi:hypothetical protein